MLILKSIVHETIWGGSKLTAYTESGCYKIGHLYGIFCNPEMSNEILNGPYRGQRLNDYFVKVKSKYGLEKYPYFPLIIALVDASDYLSIQVHPGDQDALVLSSDLVEGKNESWYFLEAPTQGFIYDGCCCNTMEELKDAINSDKMEMITDKLKVRQGDYVYIQAGTLHAMGKGALVYEIEENAGATYRFYDFNRIDTNGKKRALQIPEAFYSININNKSRVEQYGKVPIEERKYRTQLFDNIDLYQNKSGTLQALTVLDGEMILDGIKVTKGMTILLEPSDSISCCGINQFMIAEPKISEE